MDNTSFNGIDREPTNEELLRNTRACILYSPAVMLVLWFYNNVLDHGWAGWLFAHALPVLAIAAVVFFKREILAAMLAFCLALIAGAQTFVREYGEINADAA